MRQMPILRLGSSRNIKGTSYYINSTTNYTGISMFLPPHGHSKVISTMVTPPPFGLPMAHSPWSGADCYQWLCCCNGEAISAVEVGIGHTHHCHGSSPHFRQALDTLSAQESVCFSPPPPPKPPWPPPFHKNINTSSLYRQLSFPTHTLPYSTPLTCPAVTRKRRPQPLTVLVYHLLT
jgi:hypothetical protein